MSRLWIGAVADVDAADLVVAEVPGADLVVADVDAADLVVLDLAAVDEAGRDAVGDAAQRDEQGDQAMTSAGDGRRRSSDFTGLLLGGLGSEASLAPTR